MCERCNKISGKRRRIGARKGDVMGQLSNTVMNDVAPAAVGYVAGEILDKQLTFFTKKPTVANAIKLGGGLALAIWGPPGFVSRMGVGLAANGAVDLVRPALEKHDIAGISLMPPGNRNYLVSGTPEVFRQSVPQERVVMQ